MVVGGATWDGLADEARSGAWDVVAIHSNFLSKRGIGRFIQAVRESSDAKILVGGPGATEPEAFLEAGAHAVCVGEVEHRATALIDGVCGRGDLADIPGIHYRDADGRARDTGPAPTIGDLDALPFPHRPEELVPLYGEPVNPAQTGEYISVMSARGCPFQCAFCVSHEIWGKRVRTRSVDNVLDEIAQALNDWPRAYIAFVDDIWGLSPSWAEEFCTKKWSAECVFHGCAFCIRSASARGAIVSCR
ncbi:MAG: hypothetical protein M5R36_14130 [Deltaproteobacteria bacterium]|nr:hypothetical protein [Deltaproteobacteria bacterium]